MKKLFAILSALLVITVLTLFIALIPKVYHDFVHIKLLGEKTQTGFGSSEVSSRVLIRDKSVDIKTMSFFNPLKNYTDIKIFDVQKNLELNLQISQYQKNFSQIFFDITISDKDQIGIDQQYSIRKNKLSIGPFSVLDLIQARNTNITSVLLGKSMTASGELLEWRGPKKLISLKDYFTELKFIERQDKLSIDLQLKAKEVFYNLLYTDTYLDLKLSSLNPSIFVQFVQKALPKILTSKKNFNPFMFLTYIKVIQYPFQVQMEASSQRLGEKLSSSLDVELSSNKILNLKNYNMDFNFKALPAEAFELTKNFILRHYPKILSKSYELSPSQDPSKRFLQRDEVRLKIKKILSEFMNQKPRLLLDKAIELRFLKQSPSNEEILYTKLSLNQARFQLLERALSRDKISKLAVLICDNYIESMGSDTAKLLKSNGLYTF